jgi:hypothetical protein
MTNEALLDQIRERGCGSYQVVSYLKDGTIVGLGDLMFTRAIYIDMDLSGWGKRFCFEDKVDVLLLLSVFPLAFGSTKSSAFVVTIVEVIMKKMSNKNTMSVIDDMLNSVETLFLFLPIFIIQVRLINLRNLLHLLPFD